MSNILQDKQELELFDTINISNRKRIAEELFFMLRDAILLDELPEGYVFPNENLLCKKLDIGRSSLREAYASLEAVGLITRTKNGTFVKAKVDTHTSVNFDKIAQFSNPNTVIEYRRVVEIGVARHAALRATPEDILALIEIVDSMEENANSPEALTVYDFCFHQMIAKITQNDLLVIALNSAQISYEKFVLAAFKKNLFLQSVADHRAIIRALRQNDPDEAERQMREHLSHIEAVVKAANNNV